MAKKSPNLEMPDIAPATTPVADNKKNKDNKKKPAKKQRRSVGKFFRDIISELKKVEWAKMKNKSNSGVIAQTGTVLIVVIFFMIIVSLFDMGFTELIKLLLNATV